MSRTARIALLQLPAFGIADAAASLAHTLRRIDDAASERPDLIALPEVTYPAYFLGTDDLRSVAPSVREATERIAAKARDHGVWIAAGLALDAPGSGYTNGAALFDRSGELAGRYDKSFLWHFDARWFAPGGAYPAFDTDFGCVGMLVCADGRLPEIARSLVLNGAQVVLDLTAWVSSGRRTEDLMNVQRAYMMQVRAAENGVWAACVSKFGVEAESIVYSGRSCFIDPSGRVAATLGSDEDALLVHDVPMQDAQPPVQRRPEFYNVLAHPTESLPATRWADESIVVGEQERRIAAVQMTIPATAEAFLATAGRHVDRLAMQDTDLVLFPAAPPSCEHEAALDGMLALARRHEILLAFALHEPDGHRAMYLAGPHGVAAKHRQTHAAPGAALPLGETPCPVTNTGLGRIGLICGEEAMTPEIARSLMLRGAEILLISDSAPRHGVTAVARCRADENRVFVAAATEPGDAGGALVVDPAGRVLAEALAGRDLAVSATVNRALAHLKAMAPGTDVLRNRQPATYAPLTRAESPAKRVI